MFFIWFGVFIILTGTGGRFPLFTKLLTIILRSIIKVKRKLQSADHSCGESTSVNTNDDLKKFVRRLVNTKPRPFLHFNAAGLL